MKQKRDITSKPYYRCFICPRFRTLCGGRPTRDMEFIEWCEYIRDIRDYFELSNDYITDKSQSSDGTTERIMGAKSTQDIMRSTARRYEQAVIGPVGEFTCYLDHDNTAADQIAHLQSIILELRDDLARERKENDRKAKIIDDYLARICL